MLTRIGPPTRRSTPPTPARWPRRPPVCTSRAGCSRRSAPPGIEIAFLTLHVGLGTFRPVKVEDIADHEMHEEWFNVSEATAAAVNRALEARGAASSASAPPRCALSRGRWRWGRAGCSRATGWTRIFITPGFEFRGAGAMLTNFHLPRSTLLMMISAFAGRDHVLAAYAEAVAERLPFLLLRRRDVHRVGATESRRGGVIPALCRTYSAVTSSIQQ